LHVAQGMFSNREPEMAWATCKGVEGVALVRRFAPGVRPTLGHRRGAAALF
jgi:hypothetical protein